MAIQYTLDGINVDFEKYENGRSWQMHLLNHPELSIKCKTNEVVLSVDNYVPMSHTVFITEKEQILQIML